MPANLFAGIRPSLCATDRHPRCGTKRRRPRCEKNVGITPVSPDVVEYTQV